MRAPLALLLAGALLFVGCSLGDGDDEDGQGLADRGAEDGGERRAPKAAEPRPGEPEEAEPIRQWSAALNQGEYERAASYFAPGAIVEQTTEIRLPDRDAAIAFNRSLPCRADVTDVDDEGDTILAAFRLRDGPGGACDGGSARVRFRFDSEGRFEEWRQLPESVRPEGDIA